MFISALFTIAKIWKQLKCPSTNEWIKKWEYSICIYYTHTHTHTHKMEYNPAIKKEEKKILKKEGSPAICNNMDESGWHYAK